MIRYRIRLELSCDKDDESEGDIIIDRNKIYREENETTSLEWHLGIDIGEAILSLRANLSPLDDVFRAIGAIKDDDDLSYSDKGKTETSHRNERKE
jgi:hypothetical protein